MPNFRALATTAALLCLASPVATASDESGKVNIYTDRETRLIQTLFDT